MACRAARLGARVRVEARVELAEPQPEQQQSPHGAVHVVAGQQAPLQRLGDPPDGDRGVLAVVGEAVHPGPQRRGVAGRVVGEIVLGVDEVGRGFRVAAHHQLAAARPLAQLTFQVGADVVGPPVHQVVGRHHADGHARGDRRMKRRQLIFMQHARPQRRRRGRPVGLVVVGQEVLEQRGGAQVHGMVAAQAAAVGHRGPAGQQRVF
jgi:hypothetical protein